jgi:hypothetical protein
MQRLSQTALAIALLYTGPTFVRPAAAQIDVLTHRYDNVRSGVNLKETVLNKSNVNNAKFGKLVFREVDGNIYAQLLIVTQARIVNRGSSVNVVIVATEHNSVYAFDSDDLLKDKPDEEKALWHTGPKILGNSVCSKDLFDHTPDAFN